MTTPDPRKEGTAPEEGEKMPERVWVSGHGWPAVTEPDATIPNSTEYIRADKFHEAERKLAIAEALLRVLADRKCDTPNWMKSPADCGACGLTNDEYGSE